jgi:hypothetical protein
VNNKAKDDIKASHGDIYVLLLGANSWSEPASIDHCSDRSYLIEALAPKLVLRTLRMIDQRSLQGAFLRKDEANVP